MKKLKSVFLIGLLLTTIFLILDSFVKNTSADTVGTNAYVSFGTMRLYSPANKMLFMGVSTNPDSAFASIRSNGYAAGDANNTSGCIDLLTYRYDQTWRGAVYAGTKSWRNTALNPDNCIVTLQSVSHNTTNNVANSGGAFHIKTGKNFTATPRRLPTQFIFQATNELPNGGGTSSGYLNAAKISQYGNFIVAKGIYSGFEGKFDGVYTAGHPVDTSTQQYHYYGLGNYPSFLGGVLNVNGGYNYFTDAQANDTYVVTLSGAITYVAGLEITFKANTANTDGATVNVNGLGAKALTKCASGSVATALATGDIIAGQMVKAVYDGTQFQVISRLAQ